MHNSGNNMRPSINVILALLKCCKAKSCDHLCSVIEGSTL